MSVVDYIINRHYSYREEKRKYLFIRYIIICYIDLSPKAEVINIRHWKFLWQNHNKLLEDWLRTRATKSRRGMTEIMNFALNHSQPLILMNVTWTSLEIHFINGILQIVPFQVQEYLRIKINLRFSGLVWIGLRSGLAFVVEVLWGE